jgi:hypothetical protein
MTPTLRRLNDRERYWGLTWPGWAAAVGAGGVLYGAVKVSPFAIKPTVTIAALILAVFVVVLLGVSGQALSPGRQLHAILSHHRRPTQWTLLDAATRPGLVLTSAPDRTVCPEVSVAEQSDEAEEVELAAEIEVP